MLGEIRQVASRAGAVHQHGMLTYTCLDCCPCRRESVAINSSLMTLGRCLEALRWNQQHKGGSNLRVVPYRESKVTHLFRQAAGWAHQG